jgi:hypothetical protein
LYFRPANPVPPTALAEPGVLVTRRKQFVPRVLAIPAGSSVRFPNEDTILHNVFSRSPDNGFDAGLYGAGNGFVQKFEHPGLVKVYCNVHHSMYAYILVLDTPFFARPDREGRFLIAGCRRARATSSSTTSAASLTARSERGDGQDLSIRWTSTGARSRSTPTSSASPTAEAAMSQARLLSAAASACRWRCACSCCSRC